MAWFCKRCNNFLFSVGEDYCDNCKRIRKVKKRAKKEIKNIQRINIINKIENEIDKYKKNQVKETPILKTSAISPNLTC